MAELFEKGRSTITEPLKNIFKEGELDEAVVCRNFRHTTKHGAIKGKTQTQDTKYYNLKAITAQGDCILIHEKIHEKKVDKNVRN